MNARNTDLGITHWTPILKTPTSYYEEYLLVPETIWLEITCLFPNIVV